MQLTKDEEEQQQKIAASMDMLKAKLNGLLRSLV